MSGLLTVHGDKHSQLYTVWCHIKARCYNTHDKSYKYYGGRDIKMCDEWYNNYVTFKDWAVNNGYSKGLTIDRIDVNGNYEPNNCRWVTMKQQSRNTRRNRYFTINGETHCLSEWCELLGLKYNKVQARLKRGWDIKKSLEINP